MTDETTRIFLRLSTDARPSSIDMRPVDQLLGMAASPSALTPDSKDCSVYFFEVPHGTDKKTARKAMEVLEDQASVDEVWDTPVNVKSPAAKPARSSKSGRITVRPDDF